ncbi:MAG: DUF371 domain-containing protein [Acidobacteriota bacterium]
MIVRFSCRGHSNIRATHHKTLEVTRDPEITPRATCVVGVAADFDPLAVARLRGRVRMRMRLRQGSHRAEIVGTVSPFVGVRPSLVFRLSDQIFGNTFASGASRAASHLDRGLAAVLQDSESVLEVVIEEVGEPSIAGALSLLVLPHPRRAALAPEPAERLRAVDALAAPDPNDLVELIAELQGPAEGLPFAERKRGALLERLKTGKRLAVVVPDTDDAGLRPFVRQAVQAGIPVSPLGGVAPSLTTLWVAAFEGTDWAVEEQPQRRPQRFRRRLQGMGRSPTPCVFRRVEISAEAVCAAVLETLGDRSICLAQGWGSRDERYLRGSAGAMDAGDLARFRAADPLIVAVDGDRSDEGDVPATLLRALLEGGASVRSLSRALEAETGWPRRRAYEWVQRLADESVAGED